MAILLVEATEAHCLDQHHERSTVDDLLTGHPIQPGTCAGFRNQVYPLGLQLPRGVCMQVHPSAFELDLHSPVSSLYCVLLCFPSPHPVPEFLNALGHHQRALSSFYCLLLDMVHCQCSEVRIRVAETPRAAF